MTPKRQAGELAGCAQRSTSLDYPTARGQAVNVSSGEGGMYEQANEPITLTPFAYGIWANAETGMEGGHRDGERRLTPHQQVTLLYKHLHPSRVHERKATRHRVQLSWTQILIIIDRPLVNREGRICERRILSNDYYLNFSLPSVTCPLVF